NWTLPWAVYRPSVVVMTITHNTAQIPVRLDFDRLAPVFSRAMSHLDQAATKELDAAEIDPRLRELIRIRASQLNGCAYCIDMHTKDARAIGEAYQEVAAEFSPQEIAALVSLLVAINAWNAIGVSTRAWVPGSYQPWGGGLRNRSA